MQHTSLKIVPSAFYIIFNSHFLNTLIKYCDPPPSLFLPPPPYFNILQFMCLFKERQKQRYMLSPPKKVKPNDIVLPKDVSD